MTPVALGQPTASCPSDLRQDRIMMGTCDSVSKERVSMEQVCPDKMGAGVQGRWDSLKMHKQEQNKTRRTGAMEVSFWVQSPGTQARTGFSSVTVTQVHVQRAQDLCGRSTRASGISSAPFVFADAFRVAGKLTLSPLVRNPKVTQQRPRDVTPAGRNGAISCPTRTRTECQPISLCVLGSGVLHGSRKYC